MRTDRLRLRRRTAPCVVVHAYTMAQAIERIMALVVKLSGLYLASTDQPAAQAAL
jgi:hypothetical protein